MSSEDPKDCSESQSFYKDVLEYFQKNMSLEELLSLLTEDEPWENLVTEANLSREDADGLSEYLIKQLTILSGKDQDRSQKYHQEKERFLKEFPQVKQELKENIKKLRELADKVDKVHRDCTIANVVASSTGIVSGALSILGVVLAPCTAGLSLGLSAAGLGLGTAASVTSFSTMLVESINTSSAENQASSLNTAKTKYAKLPKKIKDFGKDIQVIREARFKSELVVTGQTYIVTGQVKSHFTGPALAGSRAVRIGSGVLSGLLMALDVYNLVKNARDLQEGAKTASAENMRQKARELEKKLEKLTWIYESLQ
ncbi:hypothetical protein K5549_012788 [Capra hircus]|nr:hypothetical protein K5549_012788 [Capra hircus]